MSPALSACRNVVCLVGGLLVGFILSKVSLLLLTADHPLLSHCGRESFAPFQQPKSGTGVSSPSAANNASLNGNRDWRLESRPHFIADELNIRQRLLLVAVSSDSPPKSPFADGFEEALKMLSAKIDLLQYGDSPVPNSDLKTVRGSGTLSAFEYIAYRRLDQFDFYLLLPDTTYLNGFVLERLLNGLSAMDEVVMNFASKSDGSCSFKTGLLISNSALKSLLPRVAICVLQDPERRSSVEQCLGSLVCTNRWNDVQFESVTAVRPIEDLRNVVTVQDVDSVDQVRLLNLKFQVVERQRLSSEIDQLSAHLLDLYSEANVTMTLPLGTAEPWQSGKRHDLLLWDFFDEQNIFEVSNQWNYVPLSAVQMADTKSAVAAAVDWLKKQGKIGDNVKLQKLISGYRRLDPIRGMEYVLDLQLVSEGEEDALLQRKRVFLLKQLGSVEILPVPFVDESATLTVLLPVTEMDVQAADAFLHDFQKYYLVNGEKCKLLVLFMLKRLTEQSTFQKTIGTLNSWRSQLRSVGLQQKISYMVLRVKSYSILNVLDHVVGRLKRTELLLLVSPLLECREELLNRVRVNTIKDVQVFFPVPFVRYHARLAPNGAAGSGNPKLHLDINRDTGQFDLLNYDVASFYSTDYAKARLAVKVDNLFDTFAGDSRLTVLRAVDPAVRLHHGHVDCEKKYTHDDRRIQSCRVQLKENLGTKAQLVSFVFDQTDGNK